MVGWASGVMVMAAISDKGAGRRIGMSTTTAGIARLMLQSTGSVVGERSSHRRFEPRIAIIEARGRAPIRGGVWPRSNQGGVRALQSGGVRARSKSDA